MFTELQARVVSYSTMTTIATVPQGTPDRLSFTVETGIDFDDTARIANASFGFTQPRFSSSYLEWLYRKGFGGDTTVVVARSGKKKIGQATVLWHPISVNGASHRGAQLIDLFVDPAFRSYEVVAGIYSGLREQLKSQENSVIVTVPNEKATVFNKRFLKLRDAAVLNVRAGIAAPCSGVVRSAWCSSARERDAVALIGDSIPAYGGIAVEWTPERLLDRLSRPGRRYAIHRCGGLLAVTTFQVRRGVPFFLVCGLFADPGRQGVCDELKAVLWRAAIMHRWPIYCHLGTNNQVQIRGVEIPTRLRPSTRMQVRLTGNIEPSSISRFEALDFDLA